MKKSDPKPKKYNGLTQYDTIRKKADEAKKKQVYPKKYSNSLGKPLTPREKIARGNFPSK